MVFRTALIVDDSKLARVTLKKKLESYGLLVEMSESARDAYRDLPVINPDIIFMDHLMPDIDGFEATVNIRQMAGFQHIPIVMCTGKDHDGYLAEALSIGANYILSKPPVDEALHAILEGAGEEQLLVTLPEAVIADAVDDTQAEAAWFTDDPVEPLPGPDDIVDENAGQIIAPDIIAVAVVPEPVTVIEPELEPEPEPAPLPEPVAVPVPGISAAEVGLICAQIIAAEKAIIIADVLASIPEPEIVMPEVHVPDIDMDSILSTVNAAVSHQLAVNMSVLKTAIAGQIEQTVDSRMADKMADMMEQDIQGILDLRLNITLAERFAQTNSRIDDIASQFDRFQDSPDSSMDALVTLHQPAATDTGSRMEQMYEELMQLRSRVRIFQVATIVAVLLGAAAIVVATVL